MGFCRRCGEIVPPQAIRCKCGGPAVAPAVSWNQPPQKDGHSPDRWAKTYMSTETAAQCMPPSNEEVKQPKTERRIEINNQSPTRSIRRFPRPLSTIGPSRPLCDPRLSNHIASTTAQQGRTPSPVKSKSSLILNGSPGSIPTDVIAFPDNATLAKAYGSILQPPQTLPIHTCARCSSIFLPDATIYPDPEVLPESSRFLCKPCFAAHGGSKGNCASCGRDVLIIAQEGGFVENAGRVWHKRCFRCEGCHKDIVHAPMVDLFGRPSCSECFDSCIDRTAPKKKKPSEMSNNIGGFRRSRESSPALDELSERLGIKRQVSPEINRDPFREMSKSPSPLHVSANRDNPLRGTFGSSLRASTLSHQTKTLRASSDLSTTMQALDIGSPHPEPPTPALSFSSSRSDSVSSFVPSTPSSSPRRSLTPSSRESITPKGKTELTPSKVSTTRNPKCGRCLQSLFNTSGNGSIVTVPADSVTELPSSYHASCFRCFVCGDLFDGQVQGHVKFVKDHRGVCHPECIIADQHQQAPLRRSPARPVPPNESISEYPLKSVPPFSRTLPRFGGSETCPGCRKPVSLMEYGVVTGPQNSRWHVSCLVCGGKGAKLPRPGCGKRLDSAAKTDYDGGVWCRECMLLLPPGTCTSPQGSPTRSLTPSYTGSTMDRFPRPEANRLFGQVTGNTYGRTPDMLTTQHTGSGVGLLRRGSVSPTRHLTRSVSPTKGLMPVTRHPRPVGSWKHKSVDEGRGMFLVRQMTGNGQS